MCSVHLNSISGSSKVIQLANTSNTPPWPSSLLAQQQQPPIGVAQTHRTLPPCRHRLQLWATSASGGPSTSPSPP